MAKEYDMESEIADLTRRIVVLERAAGQRFVAIDDLKRRASDLERLSPREKPIEVGR